MLQAVSAPLRGYITSLLQSKLSQWLKGVQLEGAQTLAMLVRSGVRAGAVFAARMW
jgi:hypothetical protein